MPREQVTDARDRIIGYLDHRCNGEIVVRDRYHRILGYVNDQGTFDASRRRVSSDRLPGLLLSAQE